MNSFFERNAKSAVTFKQMNIAFVTMADDSS